MKNRSEYRIYPFDTPGELATGILAGLSFIGALGLVGLYGESFWSQALLALSVIIFLLYVIPRLIAWLLALLDAGMQAQAEYRATTSKLLEIEASIQLERERRQSIQALRSLQAPQLEYALKLMDFSDIINISGTTVNWVVDGQSIPVDFAIDWMEAYKGRPGNQLPAQSDFSGSVDRDNKRRYVKAITAALMRAGYVRDAGGPIPPRWLVQDEKVRASALAGIGLELAYDLAVYVAEKRGES